MPRFHLPLRRTVPALVIIPAVALLPLSCGGASDEPPAQKSAAPAATPQPAAAVDACALLTRAEAETALGKPVGEPVRQDVPPVFSCAYQAAGGIEGVSINVTAFSDARQAADAHQLAIKINNYEEIKGVGDRAYRSLIFDLTVLKGRYELSVDLTSSGDSKDAEFQKAKDLATRALARLQ
jgi:hypothetical protein